MALNLRRGPPDLCFISTVVQPLVSRASTVAGFEAGARGRTEAVDRSGSELEALTLLSGRLGTGLRRTS